MEEVRDTISMLLRIPLSSVANWLGERVVLYYKRKILDLY